jgi:hypothetical protein
MRSIRCFIEAYAQTIFYLRVHVSGYSVNSMRSYLRSNDVPKYERYFITNERFFMTFERLNILNALSLHLNESSLQSIPTQPLTHYSPGRTLLQCG